METPEPRRIASTDSSVSVPDERLPFKCMHTGLLVSPDGTVSHGDAAASAFVAHPGQPYAHPKMQLHKTDPFCACKHLSKYRPRRGIARGSPGTQVYLREPATNAGEERLPRIAEKVYVHCVPKGAAIPAPMQKWIHAEHRYLQYMKTQRPATLIRVHDLALVRRGDADSEHEDVELCVYMDYAEGGSLRQWFSKCIDNIDRDDAGRLPREREFGQIALPEACAAHVTRSLLLALDFLANAPSSIIKGNEGALLHRDICADNVLVLSRPPTKTRIEETRGVPRVAAHGVAEELLPRAVLSDFDASEPIASAATRGTGRTWIVPPERLRTGPSSRPHPAGALAKGDVFAVGMLLVQMQGGGSDAEMNELHEAICADSSHAEHLRTPRPTLLSDEIRQFLKGLLHGSPDKRFSTMDALKHPWLQKHQRRDASEFPVDWSPSFYSSYRFAMSDQYGDEQTKEFAQVGRGTSVNHFRVEPLATCEPAAALHTVSLYSIVPLYEKLMLRSLCRAIWMQGKIWEKAQCRPAVIHMLQQRARRLRLPEDVREHLIASMAQPPAHRVIDCFWQPLAADVHDSVATVTADEETRPVCRWLQDAAKACAMSDPSGSRVFKRSDVAALNARADDTLARRIIAATLRVLTAVPDLPPHGSLSVWTVHVPKWLLDDVGATLRCTPCTDGGPAFMLALQDENMDVPVIITDFGGLPLRNLAQHFPDAHPASLADYVQERYPKSISPERLQRMLGTSTTDAALDAIGTPGSLPDELTASDVLDDMPGAALRYACEDAAKIVRHMLEDALPGSDRLTEAAALVHDKECFFRQVFVYAAEAEADHLQRSLGGRSEIHFHFRKLRVTAEDIRTWLTEDVQPAIMRSFSIEEATSPEFQAVLRRISMRRDVWGTPAFHHCCSILACETARILRASLSGSDVRSPSNRRMCATPQDLAAYRFRLLRKCFAEEHHDAIQRQYKEVLFQLNADAATVPEVAATPDVSATPFSMDFSEVCMSKPDDAYAIGYMAAQLLLGSTAGDDFAGRKCYLARALHLNEVHEHPSRWFPESVTPLAQDFILTATRYGRTDTYNPRALQELAAHPWLSSEMERWVAPPDDLPPVLPQPQAAVLELPRLPPPTLGRSTAVSIPTPNMDDALRQKLSVLQAAATQDNPQQAAATLGSEPSSAWHTRSPALSEAAQEPEEPRAIAETAPTVHPELVQVRLPDGSVIMTTQASLQYLPSGSTVMGASASATPMAAQHPPPADEPQADPTNAPAPSMMPWLLVAVATATLVGVWLWRRRARD